jgi:hydrogenase maturation protease
LSNKLQDTSQPGIGREILLFGIGNSGRGDDGLGWSFVDRIRQETDFAGQLEYRYQLQVEDAALVRDAERVIFIDSYKGELPGGFQWKQCEPSNDFQFTTHVLPPGGVLHFCQHLYGKKPRADLLMIQGTSWDLRVGISPEAERHLEYALRFFKNKVLA